MEPATFELLQSNSLLDEREDLEFRISKGRARQDQVSIDAYILLQVETKMRAPASCFMSNANAKARSNFALMMVFAFWNATMQL